MDRMYIEPRALPSAIHASSPVLPDVAFSAAVFTRDLFAIDEEDLDGDSGISSWEMLITQIRSGTYNPTPVESDAATHARVLGASLMATLDPRNIEAAALICEKWLQPRGRWARRVRVKMHI
jgi:hypothetical protein